jgi:hypothetical protein
MWLLCGMVPGADWWLQNGFAAAVFSLSISNVVVFQGKTQHFSFASVYYMGIV